MLQILNKEAYGEVKGTKIERMTNEAYDKASKESDKKIKRHQLQQASVASLINALQDKFFLTFLSY